VVGWLKRAWRSWGASSIGSISTPAPSPAPTWIVTWKHWLKVKAALELAAQCAVDLALEMVTRRGLGAPQSYREAFALLGRAGVLDAGLASDLESWAGLRNVLVHVYTALDLDRIHQALAQTAGLRSFHALAARETARGG
jgi:uncharacterized protein YutE (UPF0331/DUF86 family)